MEVIRVWNVDLFRILSFLSNTKESPGIPGKKIAKQITNYQPFLKWGSFPSPTKWLKRVLRFCGGEGTVFFVLPVTSMQICSMFLQPNSAWNHLNQAICVKYNIFINLNQSPQNTPLGFLQQIEPLWEVSYNFETPKNRTDFCSLSGQVKFSSSKLPHTADHLWPEFHWTNLIFFKGWLE